MLWFFVAANAPEAVARMRASPNAVLLNIVSSPGCLNGTIDVIARDFG
jgi:hypothetical protein